MADENPNPHDERPRGRHIQEQFVESISALNFDYARQALHQQLAPIMRELRAIENRAALLYFEFREGLSAHAGEQAVELEAKVIDNQRSRLRTERRVIAEDLGRRVLGEPFVHYVDLYIAHELRVQLCNNTEPAPRLPVLLGSQLPGLVGELDFIIASNGGGDLVGLSGTSALPRDIQIRHNEIASLLSGWELEWRAQQEERAFPGFEQLAAHNGQKEFVVASDWDTGAIAVDVHDAGVRRPLRAVDETPRDGRPIPGPIADRLALEILREVGCSSRQAAYLAGGNRQAGGSFIRLMTSIFETLEKTPGNTVTLSGPKIAKWVSSCESRFDGPIENGDAKPRLPNVTLADLQPARTLGFD